MHLIRSMRRGMFPREQVAHHAGPMAGGLLRMKRPQPTGGVAGAAIHSTVISRCQLVQMPAGFPIVRQYIDRSLHLIVVGASHDERMGIYDER